jgi:hypothetical protein
MGEAVMFFFLNQWTHTLIIVFNLQSDEVLTFKITRWLIKRDVLTNFQKNWVSPSSPTPNSSTTEWHRAASAVTPLSQTWPIMIILVSINSKGRNFGCMEQNHTWSLAKAGQQLAFEFNFRSWETRCHIDKWLFFLIVIDLLLKVTLSLCYM